MYISSFQISNYKSYNTPLVLELNTGFNIVVGPNNVGKTALLEALSLDLVGKNNPHLHSTRTLNLNKKTRIQVSITVSREELLDIHSNIMPEISIPIPSTDQGLPFDRSNGLHDLTYHEKLCNWFFSHDTFTFSFQVSDEGPIITNSTSFGLYDAPAAKGVTRHYIKHIMYPDGTTSISGLHNDDESKSDFGVQMIQYLISQIYRFRSERVTGPYYAGTKALLDADARNLAEVLDNLQRNPYKFQRFNELVRKVLPQIQQITVLAPGPDVQFREVGIWTTDPKSERLDLAIPLSHSGTGIGQVLAMLYVVFMSDYPRTILIDEPQSFLHSGAIRKLIEILKIDYPQHQYIIATHSPTVIAASGPSTIIRVKQVDGVSDLEKIDIARSEDLRNYLADIGVRLSDVFGADAILWVEGATEEICFPLILEKVARKPLMGTVILGVKQTGDFEGKHARTVFEIYDKLSKSSSLMPKAIGFIFDKEGRSDQEQADLQKRSNGLVAFTSRRLYENYLLNPEAIAAVINDIEGFRETPVTAQEIQEWFDEKGKDKKYERQSKSNLDLSSPEVWVNYVHGAKILKALFSDLSEARVNYVKTDHSVKITKWLIEHNPKELEEIVQLLCNKLHLV